MYTEHYQFTGLPFQLTPDARFFFGSSGHNKAMAHLTYGISQGEGFIIITGEVGAGKTTIVDHLFQQLDSQQFIAAKIANTQLGADDTLRMVASAFDIPQEGADKATLLRRFEGFLATVQARGQRALLVIDECQNLSVQAIEELRMLSNLQIDGRTPLQSFLLGQPQFRDTLARDELEQLRQRVIASYHLGPLNPTETRNYIEHRLNMVGWKGDPQLSDGFFPAVHRLTGGVPRKINTLCSRILLYGYLEDRHDLGEAEVEEVARDLDQEVKRVLPPEPEPRRPAPTSRPMAVAGLHSGAHAVAHQLLPQPDDDLQPAIDEILHRLTVVESYIRSQDRMLRRLLQLALLTYERQQ